MRLYPVWLQGISRSNELIWQTPRDFNFGTSTNASPNAAALEGGGSSEAGRERQAWTRSFRSRSREECEPELSYASVPPPAAPWPRDREAYAQYVGVINEAAAGDSGSLASPMVTLNQRYLIGNSFGDLEPTDPNNDDQIAAHLLEAAAKATAAAAARAIIGRIEGLGDLGFTVASNSPGALGDEKGIVMKGSQDPARRRRRGRSTSKERPLALIELSESPKATEVSRPPGALDGEEGSVTRMRHVWHEVLVIPAESGHIGPIGRYFIGDDSSQVAPTADEHTMVNFDLEPRGPLVGSRARAAVLVEAVVRRIDGDYAQLDLGECIVVVNRRALSTDSFLPPGVEVVCFVRNSLVAPAVQEQCMLAVANATVLPKVEDISLIDYEVADAECVHANNSSLSVEIREFIRQEIRRELKVSGVALGRPPAPVEDDMHTCVSRYPLPRQDGYESSTVPSAWGNEPRLEQQFQKHMATAPGLFTNNGRRDERRTVGLSMLDPDRPASEPSVVAMEQEHARSSKDGMVGGVVGASDFKFDAVAPIHTPKPLSEAAKRFATPGVKNYSRPNHKVRLGDSLLLVDRLLVIQGARCAQLSPEQCLKEALRTTPPKIQQQRIVTPPPPPRVNGSAGGSAATPARSKLVEASWGFLQSVVDNGRATHVLAQKQPAESNNDKLRRVMQNSARIYGVWDHIDEQEVLFEALCRPKSKVVNVSGRNSIEPETC